MTTPAQPASEHGDPVLTLVRAFGRGDLTEDEYARVETCLAPVWRRESPESFVERLALAGVMPLAYRHLIARAPFVIPDDFRAALAAEFTRHSVSRFRMAHRLCELLGVLAAAGVDAVPYKGPALAVQLYGNYAMRQYGDLDVIVRRAQIAQALDVLAREGMRPDDGEPRVPHEGRRHDHTLIDSDTGTRMELHWSITDPIDGIDVYVEWLLRDRIAIDLLGRDVAGINPSRLFLALSIHGSRHVWARAAWLADLAQLSRDARLDWDLIVAEARRLRFTRALTAGIVLARDWFGGAARPVPSPDRAVQRLVAVASAQMSAARRGPVALGDRLQWEWWTATSVVARARMLARVAMTPSVRDAAAMSSPSVHYIVPRTWRLVRTVLAERRARRPRA